MLRLTGSTVLVLVVEVENESGFGVVEQSSVL